MKASGILAAVLIVMAGSAYAADGAMEELGVSLAATLTDSQAPAPKVVKAESSTIEYLEVPTAAEMEMIGDLSDSLMKLYKANNVEAARKILETIGVPMKPGEDPFRAIQDQIQILRPGDHAQQYRLAKAFYDNTIQTLEPATEAEIEMAQGLTERLGKLYVANNVEAARKILETIGVWEPGKNPFELLQDQIQILRPGDHAQQYRLAKAFYEGVSRE